MPLTIIVAVDNKGGFGKDGKIPWHFKEDFKQFKEKTNFKPCVMGRKTYEDMVSMTKRDISQSVLPNRQCYVLSKTDQHFKGAIRVTSLQEVIRLHEGEEIMVLGGEQIYKEALPRCNTVHMTVIDSDYQCDRFFPVEKLESFSIQSGSTMEENGKKLYFVTYTR